jgi:hypothetical protein
MDHRCCPGDIDGPSMLFQSACHYEQPFLPDDDARTGKEAHSQGRQNGDLARWPRKGNA